MFRKLLGKLFKKPSRKPKPEEFRRIKRLKPTEANERMILENKEDFGNNKGDKFIRFWMCDESPLDFFDKLKKPNPQIMIIGPGLGEDLIDLHGHLIAKGFDPKIDVFGLTKTVTLSAQKVVRKDYSQNVALETIGANPEKYAELVNALKGKYDLVTAYSSAGYHTQFPAQNCFFMAMMLAGGGEAHIDIASGKRLFSSAALINNAKYLKEVFPRIVKAYNRKSETNYQFELKFERFDQYRYVVIIKRIS